MKKLFFGLFGLCLLQTACKKMQVDAPDLDITLENASLKAGDTARFRFSGYADYISFYSGEPGRDYERRDSFTRTDGVPELQFSTAVSAAGTGITTGRNLSVLVSSDFSGVYTAEGVARATWTDITGRATLATGTSTVASPVIKLDDLKVAGKPLYVAFKYVTSDAALKQRQWTVSAFQFRTRFPDSTVYTHAAANADAVLTPVNAAGDSATWVSGTTLTHVGLNAAYPVDEDWAISRPFDLTRAASLDAARGGANALGVVTVKNLALTGTVPEQFVWRYAKAGTYKAVFILRNATIEESREEKKEFTITVAP
ncbi:DUF5017 domain-containing protein [Paraflavisolibacter sp. H34]|uniref:DUF5017 domain-containing protein n=1 Tax=Huijunlia imazamoxiresistens TaxID=3127457 RepID=UPI003015CBA9